MTTTYENDRSNRPELETETEPSFGKSVEDMLEELNLGGVTVNIFSPHFFSSSYTKEWHVDIKKKTETLEVSIHGEQTTLRDSVREAYNAWHDTLKSGVREKLNYTPQIEHKAEIETLSGIEALHREALGDDEPPF